LLDNETQTSVNISVSEKENNETNGKYNLVCSFVSFRKLGSYIKKNLEWGEPQDGSLEQNT
jgi:hypothetical protein